MIKFVSYLFVLVLFVLPGKVHSQDLDARSPHSNGGAPQQVKADKKKAAQVALKEKAIEKGKKRHMKLQAKNTKKMMKKSKHTSSNWNANKIEFFLKRWFRKKHH